jgi:ppGpp synthetase/RelA/SpoT-type nucleotidyltranferase
VHLIEDFIARYRKEYDFYDQAARLVAQALEANLQAAGIRSRVTSRAKAVGRLESKIRQRALTSNYTSVEEIYDDIIDLAGARVELYFPAEGPQVDTLIKELFRVSEAAKEFPKASKPGNEIYGKRFSGYWATHYRVYLRETSLSDAQKRYAEARVEIQVASVLMHAWAEVEHDLVYKPLQGELSEAEYAILDELNGLVIAGEIALERLQRAGETRVAAGERPFSNHYDLAAHLLSAAGATLRGPEVTTAIGRVDLLFELLGRLNLATPIRLKPYLDALHSDTERRPFSEQVIDQLLAEDGARYQIYEDIRAKQPDFRVETRTTEEPDLNDAMAFFLTQWIAFERAFREKIRSRSGVRNIKGPLVVPSFQLLEKLGLLDRDDRRDVEWIKQLRNHVVHGVEIASTSELRRAGERIQVLTERLRDDRGSPVSP